MPETSEFGSWVRERLAGRNYRDAAEEIGLHFTTLYDLAKGRTKSRETVIRFARGVGVSVNEALERAGMEPEGTSTAERYLQALRELMLEFGKEEVSVSLFEGIEKMTDADADRRLAAIRRQMEIERAAKQAGT